MKSRTQKKTKSCYGCYHGDGGAVDVGLEVQQDLLEDPRALGVLTTVQWRFQAASKLLPRPTQEACLQACHTPCVPNASWV